MDYSDGLQFLSEVRRSTNALRGMCKAFTEGSALSALDGHYDARLGCKYLVHVPESFVNDLQKIVYRSN